jgi:hypothetical protein
VSRLEDNLRILRASHPEVSPETLSALALPGDGSVAIEPTPSGSPTAVSRGALVHSRYDPAREAAQVVEREADPEATVCIILGFGLGYAAEAFRSRFPATPLLVVEPDAEFFRAALASRDLSSLLSSAGTLFQVGGSPEEITGLLEAVPLEKPQFLRLRPVTSRNPAPFSVVEEIVRSHLLRRDININTLNRFGRLWVRNLSANLGQFLRAPGVSTLSGAFTGIPALLLAGGPSLDIVLPRLRELSERLLVVAVDTPLTACLRAGVKPDFVVMVDPQYWATRYLDWTGAFDGFLVAEPSTNPRVFRGAPRRFILSSSLFPLGAYLEEIVGEKGKLGAGGSVSTSAWDLCRVLGVSGVYTAGLDLGFPGRRTHCAGAFFEERSHAESGRLSPAELRSFRALGEIGVFPMPSNTGEPTLTDRRMVLYKWWFESQAAAAPGFPTRTLSPRALAIRGIPLVPLEEALSLPPVRAEIETRLEAARRGAAQPPGGGEAAERRAARLREAVTGLVEGLRELERLGAEGLSATAALARALSKRTDTSAALGRLEGVDRRILELSSRSIAGFLIQPLIHRIVGSRPRGAGAAAVLAASREIYEGVRESSRFQAAVLGRAAGRITASFPLTFPPGPPKN